MLKDHMVEQFKLKGKWIPSNKKIEMREEDHLAILKSLSELSNNPIVCREESCETVATAIIHSFPFCSVHGLEYLNKSK